MVWDKPTILAALRKLHKQGADLSYNALAKQQQPLVSAAAYHFGSYRSAVERAGVDYAEIVRRPRWTKAGIIKLIKDGPQGRRAAALVGHHQAAGRAGQGRLRQPAAAAVRQLGPGPARGRPGRRRRQPLPQVDAGDGRVAS